MRLTIRTELAMRTLIYCAMNDGRTVRKHEIAMACAASESHLAQVIHVLAQDGYLRTIRGRNGGLKLARCMDSITLGAIVRRMEGHAPLAACFPGGTNNCPLKPGCRLRPALARALEAFFAVLDEMTLRELVKDNGVLLSILTPNASAVSRAASSPAQ